MHAQRIPSCRWIQQLAGFLCGEFLLFLAQSKRNQDDNECYEEPKYPENCTHIITSVAVGQPARIIRRRFDSVSVHNNWNDW